MGSVQASLCSLLTLYVTTVNLHIGVSVLELEFPGRTLFPGIS